MSRNRLRIASLAALSVAAIAGTAWVISDDGPPPAPITTAEAVEGSVLSSVSATGNLQAARTINLDFPTAGRVVAVNVRPGQRVGAGTVLARIDSAVASATLQGAQAGVTASQARLQQTLSGAAPEDRASAAASVAQAAQSVRAAERALVQSRSVSRAELRTLERAVRQATQQRTLRITKLNKASRDLPEVRRRIALNSGRISTANAQLASLRQQVEQLRAQQNATTNNTTQFNQRRSALDQEVADARTALGAAQASLDQSRKEQTDACAAPGPGGTGGPGSTACVASQSAVTAAQSAVTAAQTRVDTATRNASGTPGEATALQTAATNLDYQIQTLQNRISQAEQVLAQVKAEFSKYTQKEQQLLQQLGEGRQVRVDAEQAVDNARQALERGRSAQRQTLSQAEDAVTGARASLQLAQASAAATTKAPRPGDIAGERSAIANARTTLTQAQQGMRDTTLRAPVPGTVLAVNVRRGAFSGSPPPAGAGSGGAGASESGSGKSNSGGTGGSSSTASVVLAGGTGFHVVAGFTEPDAATIHTGDTAQVTVDALGSTLRGRVVEIDRTQTVVNNVVTYNVRIAVPKAPKAARVGMTARTEVITKRRDNVITVPIAAVATAADGASTVRVMKGDGTQERRTVTVGLQGVDTVEVVDGVNAGEKVVVNDPTANPTGMG